MLFARPRQASSFGCVVNKSGRNARSRAGSSRPVRPMHVESMEERALLSAGALDATFVSGGLVTTDFGSTADIGRAVAIQSDGKIIVAGDPKGPASGNDFALTRYNPNGTLDTTFGAGGKVTTNLNKGNYVGENAYAVAIQPDGAIIAAGRVAVGTQGGWDIAMVRYRTNGSVDTTFGGSAKGKVITNLGGADVAYAIVLEPGGKIVLAGNKDVDVNNSFFALVRYNSTGTLDTSFGSGGTVLTDVSQRIPNLQSGKDVAYSVAIQSDGKIVAAGSSNSGAASAVGDFAVVRYNANGSIDGTFGSGGIVLTDIQGTGQAGDEAHAVLVQSDGRLIVAGTAGGFSDRVEGVTEGYGFALTRYNSDGSLDSTFGAGGIVATNVITGNDDKLNAAALQSDGKVVVAGFTSTGICCDVDFALARYTTAGALDSSFGSSGVVTTNFSGGDDRANGVAIQADGKIVAAGQSAGNFAVARYLGDPPQEARVAAMVVSRDRYVGVDQVLATRDPNDPGQEDTTDSDLQREIVSSRRRLRRHR